MGQEQLWIPKICGQKLRKTYTCLSSLSLTTWKDFNEVFWITFTEEQWYSLSSMEWIALSNSHEDISVSCSWRWALGRKFGLYEVMNVGFSWWESVLLWEESRNRELPCSVPEVGEVTVPLGSSAAYGSLFQPSKSEMDRSNHLI